MKLIIYRDRLIRRGSESKRHMGREESEEGLKRLIEWAARYDTRTDMRSRTGHAELMERFNRTKLRIQTEADLARLIGTFGRQESEGGEK